MKREESDKLESALEYADRSAEYHVRNYAGGTLMPREPYGEMSLEERDKLYLGPDSHPGVYSKLYRSQREKEMREEGMSATQIKARWDAMNAKWRREIEERLYGERRMDAGSEKIISEYERMQSDRGLQEMREKAAVRRKSRNRGRRLMIYIVLSLVLISSTVIVGMDAAGIIDGTAIKNQIFDGIDQVFNSMDSLSPGNPGVTNGSGSGNWGGTILIYGVVIFLIYSIFLKKKTRTAPDESNVYTELIPEVIRRKYGEDSTYSRQGEFSDAQMRRLNCFVGRPFTLDGRELPVTGRDMIEGTYNGVHFKSCYEYMEYEYYYESSDGEREKKIDKLFGGIVVEIPYRKVSSVPLGVRGNSQIEMKNKVKSRTDRGAVAKIEKTENDDFNLLFTINSRDEENIFYILTPDVMEKLAALYPKEKSALHVTFDEDRLYMCLSTDDEYMVFKDKNRTGGMHGMEALLDRYLRKLQEALDAALLI